MRVLITRPTGVAQAAADQLRVAGHDVLVCPLISFAKTQTQAPSLAATQGFIVTDSDGARALADMVGVRTFPVFCDSAGTATELAGLGFQDARSADGDATALARLIERSLSPKLGGLIYACSTSAPINLSAMLGNMGFAVRMVTLYEVQRVERLPDNLIQALKVQALDAAVFFTADEARAFAQLVVGAQLEHRVSSIVAVVAAPVVAAPLSVLKFAKVVTASRSDAASVCQMMTESLVIQPEPEPDPMPESEPTPVVDSAPEPEQEPVVEAAPTVQLEPEIEPTPEPVVAETVAETVSAPVPEQPAPVQTEEPPPEPARPSWRERLNGWFAKPVPSISDAPVEVAAEAPVVVAETLPQEPEPVVESAPDVQTQSEPERQPEPIFSESVVETVAAPEPEQPAPVQTEEPFPRPARSTWRERLGVLFAKPSSPVIETSVEVAADTPVVVIETQPLEQKPEPIPESVAVVPDVATVPPVAEPLVEPESEPTRPSWLATLRERFTKPAAPPPEIATEAVEQAAVATVEERVVEPEPIAAPTPENAAPAVASVEPSVARALLERTSAWVRQRAEGRKAEGEGVAQAPEPKPVSLPEPIAVEVAPIAAVAKIETPPEPEPLPPIETEAVLSDPLPAEPKPVSDESFAAARAGWLDWAKNYLATKTNTPETTVSKTESRVEETRAELEAEPARQIPETVAELPPEKPAPTQSVEPIAEQEPNTSTLSDLRPNVSEPVAKPGWLSRLWAARAPADEATPTPIAAEPTVAIIEPIPTDSVQTNEALEEKSPPKESALATISPAPDVEAPVPVPDPPPEPQSTSEPLIVVPPPVKTPETPPQTVAAEMSETETTNSNDPDAPRVQRTSGRAARLLAEDAADARALNQRFKVAGSETPDEEAEQAGAASTPTPPPQRRGLPGIVYVMLLLIVAGGAAYIYVPDMLKRARAPATSVATAPQATPPATTPVAVAPAKPEPTPAAVAPAAETGPLAARITALEQRATPTPADVAALEQRLAALEAAVKASSPAELSDSVTNQARQLTTVTARVATLEAAIGNVAKLEDMATRLNALEGKSAAAASVLALSERVSSLEKRDAVAATALVVASAQLRDVVRAGRPYGVELETVKQLSQRAGVAFNAESLSGAALTGLATREQLLSSFGPMAAKAARAGLLPAETADWFQRISDRVLSIISIRPFGNTEGDSVGAILARAEQALRANTVALAVTEMNALTGAAAEAAAPWMISARAYVAAEQSLDELATRSVGAMGATTATTPAPAATP